MDNAELARSQIIGTRTDLNKRMVVQLDRHFIIIVLVMSIPGFVVDSKNSNMGLLLFKIVFIIIPLHLQNASKN